MFWLRDFVKKYMTKASRKAAFDDEKKITEMKPFA